PVWHWRALTVKLQMPRSTTAIMPVTLGGTWQASLVVPPVVAGGGTAVLPSLESTAVPVMSNVCGPKPEAPMPSLIVMGGVVTSWRLGRPFQTYICMRGDLPSLSVLMLALFAWPLRALSCASARRGSFSNPPRPKFESCATPDFSSKPESYQQ